MKKWLLLILIAIVLINLSGCNSCGNDENQNNNENVKKEVTLKANDIIAEYNKEIVTNGYVVTKGSIAEEDLDDLNIEVVIYKYGENYKYPQIIPNFGCIYYDVVGIEYDEHKDYSICVERGDLSLVGYTNSEEQNDYSDIITWDVTSNDEYSESFFNEQSDFINFEDLAKKTAPYDVTNSEYIPPIDLKGYDLRTLIKFLEEYPLEAPRLVAEARYYEELNAFKNAIKERANYYQNELTNLENVTTWDFTKNVEDWILYRFDFELSEYIDIDEILSPYDYAVENGYVGSESEFIKILQQTKSNQIKEELGNLRFDGDLYTLAFTIYNNASYYYNTLSKYDENYYLDIVEKNNFYQNLMKEISNKASEIKSWNNYFTEDLLGFGGILTDYPDKPLFTSTNEKGNQILFYFNYVNTTFKIVEQDTNNNIINTWYSNPNANNTYLPSSSGDQMKSVINITIQKTFGSYSETDNYSDSVSFINTFNEELKPNYSIYIEKDEKGNASKLIVWYEIKNRDIIIPSRISKTKMDEYLERNAKIAEMKDQRDRNGKLITNLYSKENILRLKKFLDEYYVLVYADDPNNEFGYDYYEYDGSIALMSQMVKDFLITTLYDWCGCTEEDLANDKKEFDSRYEGISPVQIALEYQLINGKLHVSIPKNSLVVDKNIKIYNLELLRYFYKEE